MKPKRSLDLTSGPILKKLIIFTLPILATNLLQQFYNAADQIVVGQFAENGKAALAAVGATGSSINLIVNLFFGLAVGANIVCANLKGSKNYTGLRQAMHSGILLGGILGIFICSLGIAVARPVMRMMNCPEDIIDLSVLYFRIIFCGKPFVLVYNFASGIMRAHGDTRRPMMILSTTGILNVLLNLIFVIFCKMSVAGVALATIIAQMVSCGWALWILFDPKDEFKLTFSELKLHGPSVKTILRVGIPCGINSSMFRSVGYEHLLLRCRCRRRCRNQSADLHPQHFVRLLCQLRQLRGPVLRRRQYPAHPQGGTHGAAAGHRRYLRYGHIFHLLLRPGHLSV